MVDQDRIAKAFAEVVKAIGDDPTREGLSATPTRVAQLYSEFFSGLGQDPAEALATGFKEGHKDMVVLKEVRFFSICEHHFLPFYGLASIGYVPSGRVVGISKLARALDILARRPQIQERLTRQLADVIYDSLHPEGVSVVLSAEHMCVSLRGANKPGAVFKTSANRGSMSTNESLRHEFDRLLGPD